MAMIYHVVHKSEHGGFWDGERCVREIEVRSPETAKRLEQEGHGVTVVSQCPDFSAMKAEELRSYAAAKGIDLAGAKTKAQMIERIKDVE